MKNGKEGGLNLKRKILRLKRSCDFKDFNRRSWGGDEEEFATEGVCDGVKLFCSFFV